MIDRWSIDDQTSALVDSFDKQGFEVTNGAVFIWATEESGAYDYGLYHWRSLVFGYFPGQIFGYETKRALMFEQQDEARDRIGYKAMTGTTNTGMADCFQSFGYFGFVKFLLMGYVMGRWYARALTGRPIGTVELRDADGGRASHGIPRNTLASQLLGSHGHLLVPVPLLGEETVGQATASNGCRQHRDGPIRFRRPEGVIDGRSLLLNSLSLTVMNEPLVSICIPTYNRAAKLQETSRLLVRDIEESGHLSEVEICISDNASTDGTPAVIDSLLNSSVRVRTWRNITNLGFSRNLEQVVRLAEGRDSWRYLATTIR